MDTLAEDVKKLITKKAIRDAIETLMDNDEKDELEVVVNADEDEDKHTVIIERVGTR